MGKCVGSACALTDLPVANFVTDPALNNPPASGPGGQVDISASHIAPTMAGTIAKFGNQIATMIAYAPDTSTNVGHISVLVPEQATPTDGNFTLTTCDGTSAVTPVTIGSTHAPVVNSITPSSGPSGTTITVTGMYLTGAANGLVINANTNSKGQLTVTSDTSASFMVSGVVAGQVYRVGIDSGNGVSNMVTGPTFTGM